jgi:CRP-like cAMP-binding protein
MSEDVIEALRRSPLLELLSAAELEVLAGLVQPRSFAAGEVIFEEGEVGASLFVLAEGTVEVVRGAGAKAKVLAALSAPESFGEMALIDREQRSATVRARRAVRALELGADAFAAFRKRSRDGFTLIVMNLARVLSGRLRETSARLARPGA